MPSLRVAVIIDLDGQRLEGADFTEIIAGKERITAEAGEMVAKLTRGLLAALPEDRPAEPKKGRKERET